MYWKPSVNYVIRLLLVNPGDVLLIQCMFLIYDSFFSICVYLYLFVNKMLFITRALYYSKRQIHFLSFIDIHNSLDYVSCFFGVLQRACDVRHGVSSTSMDQVIDALLSAHRASFFLNSDCIVNPTRTMFVQESHVRSLVRVYSHRVVVFSPGIGVNVHGNPMFSVLAVRFRVSYQCRRRVQLSG